MMCTPGSTVNLLFSIYFMMLALGGLLFFAVPDRIGRRSTHYIFSSVNLIGQLFALFVPIFWVRCVAMGLLGITMVKNSLCYVWLFEFMMKKHKSSACSFINLVDWAQPLIVCFYFFNIDNEVYPIFLNYTIVGIISFLLITFLCPESPKWLLL